MDPSPQQPNPQQPSPRQPSPQQLPPTVVAFLLQNGKVTAEVFSRCLLSLAEDGWLRIEPQDSGVPMVRVVRLPAPHEVKPFEQLAMERVVQRMGTLTHVPLSALTSSEGEDYEPWWKNFGEAVTAEARSAGMFGRRFSVAFSCMLPLAVAVVGAVTLGALTASSIAGILGGGLAAYIGLAIIVNVIGRTQLTDAGRAAAAWWRERGGGLGGAVITDRLPPGAVPSAHSTESLVARGSEPLPDDHVWSSYSGQWRMVKVGSPDVPSWGHPSGAVVLGVFGTFFTVPLTMVGHFVVGGGLGILLGLAPAAITGTLILGAWLPAYRRRAAIPTHEEFTGQIVKRWSYESGGDDSTTYYCCIDDDSSQEGWSFRIEHTLYTRMRVGDIVTVDFNPRWHTVNQIALAMPAPGPRA
jgi:hypothetical protein